MRIPIIVAGAIVCVGAYVALTRVSASGGEPKNNIVQVRTGDTAIAKARAEAQATLDGFLQRARSPMPQQGNFAVKIGVGGESGPREFVWITKFRLDGETGAGTLDNVPLHVPELKSGQMVTFRRLDVTDWTYRDGKTLKGNFTGCAILATAPDAAERRRRFLAVGLDCSQPRV